MIRILFVDDSIERIREIISWLKEYEVENVSEYVTTKEEALIKMSVNQYDLVIIDIALPNDIRTTDISKNAGLEIVNEICFGRRIIRPLHMIGITSNQESYDEVKNDFDNNYIPLSVWEIGDEQWKTKLIAKIKYISKLTKEYSPINTNKVDVVIIATVEDEYLVLNDLPITWEEVRVPNDPLLYYKGILFDGRSILKVKLPEMGMSAASHVTTKIIECFEPKSIAMIGICGGVKGEVNLGDIIVSERTWDYGSGKIKKDETGNMIFAALPNQICIDTNLRSDIERNANIITEIYTNWNIRKRDSKSSMVRIGAITTGAAVIADESIINSIIEPQYRKVMGIDMETYGVYFACKNSGKNIKFVSIKAVSDMADEKKDDSYHSYCSYVSATFVYRLIELGVL